MREIHCDQITAAVRECVLKANVELPPDIREALNQAYNREDSSRARQILKILLTNAEMAEEKKMAICQDTGLVAVNIDMGQEVHVVGGDINQAVNEGVRQGYRDGYFRKSVVSDPLQRINSGDNTPAIIHYQLLPGDHFNITVLPKGAGSENMGQLTMLKPAQGLDGMRDFVVRVVKEAGANACPPLIVGVGIGGNMEMAAYLAKKALLRPVDERHHRADLAVLESELLEAINRLGFGPQGMGGQTSALAVNIETYPTHIACLPVAVSLGCHATRRSSCTL
jgi:fumarate hydratase subunit alpha